MTIHSKASRRQLLRWGGGLSFLGATGAPLALQLAATGAAAGSSASGYKALVCIFMQGGQDSNNLVLATDADSWGRYTSARNTGQTPINLLPVGAPKAPPPPNGQLNAPQYWGGVLPITTRTPQPIPAGTNATTRTFALHPMLAQLLPIYDAGRLAILANVGTLIQPTTKAQFQASLAGNPSVPIPAQLFSHNDQTNTWQAGAIEGARFGWGGQMGDMLESLNGANSIFTAISTGGNAVFLSGNSVVQYIVASGVGMQPASQIGIDDWALATEFQGQATLDKIIVNQNTSSTFANDYATVVQRSLSASSTINNAVAAGAAANIPVPPAYTNPALNATQTNSLAQQLYTVAKLIAAAPGLGVQRQVFFVGFGFFDTHANQNIYEPGNLSQLAQGLAYFDTVLSSVGGIDMRPNVTTFTASEFSRSFTANGSGTDHAWGGHHLIMGGAVKGQDMYGQYPTLGIDLGSFVNPNMAGNDMVPTTSVDQYGATLGRWFGVSNSDLNTIFPNLQNFGSSPYLGFV
jgi:uncharacterized protein (DUF1501 family)